MKKNKGFTLIELLAIIVILAIIAVITVPTILNVIDNAKRGTAKDSAYGYKDAINKYYVSGMLEDESIKLSGEYNVVDGKLGEYDIPFSGTKPTSGYLTFENNILTSGCLTIDEYKVTFDKGEVANVEVGECGNANDNPANPDDSNNPTNPETPQEPETPQVTYKCKIADVSTLHTEECTQTNSTYYCSGAGYTTTGSKGTTTITYGNTTITQGTLTSGDAFDCDVDGDGEYEETERFYYVSELYNTPTKQFDSNYAVLIYYNNFFEGEPNNTSSGLIAYYPSVDKNWYGPVKAKENLPLTSTWTNITLSNTTRAIINEKGEGTSNNGSNNLPTAFSYEGYAARLLTFQEVAQACGGDGDPTSLGELDNCNYLMENTTYSNSSLGAYGYWLETPYATSSSNVWSVLARYRYVINDRASSSGNFGVRPVIEVLKTDIEF